MRRTTLLCDTASLTVAPDVFSCEVWDTATGSRGSLDVTDDRAACRALESGNILFFPESPVTPDAADRAFLLTLRGRETAAYHKNIAYRPAEDRLTGFPKKPALKELAMDYKRLHTVLKAYSENVCAFLNRLLPPYAGSPPDYATYRPIEEQGRRLRLRARNDLIHVDSFPTRPIFGDRILRFFTNLNPSQPRIWQTSEPFDVLLDVLVPRFFQSLPLRPDLKRLPERDGGKAGLVRRLLRRVGVKQSGGSPYDDWMMRLHHAMKESHAFQTQCRKDRWAFPPGSAWIVMTDMVSHSVLSGQYALEQTVIVPLEKMVVPEKSPWHILYTRSGIE